MICPRIHTNSIVAQVASVPTFLHSLDPMQSSTRRASGIADLRLPFELRRLPHNHVAAMLRGPCSLCDSRRLGVGRCHSIAPAN